MHHLCPLARATKKLQNFVADLGPDNLLSDAYSCLELGLSALNFRGRVEKVIVHMYWLTWLVWHP